MKIQEFSENQGSENIPNDGLNRFGTHFLRQHGYDNNVSFLPRDQC